MSTVKELLEKFQISQAELSRRFNIPIRTVQDWVSGRRLPPNYVVEMLEEALKRG